MRALHSARASADPQRRAASLLLGVVVHAVVVAPCAACVSAARLGPGLRHALYRLLNICTARSCLRAAASEPKVPRLRRRPVVGFFLREYRRYFPEGSLRIIQLESARLRQKRRRQAAPGGRA